METTPAQPGQPLQVVLMGVSGTGKSTVGAGVARATGWELVEGDDLHPPANIAKMEAGDPLTDEDRAPWLDEVNARARAQAAAGHSSLLTCSALKRAYRDRLRDGVDEMFFVHLAGSYEVLEPRMQARDRHFMPTGLLRSQFDTLEELEPDEDGVRIDVAGSLEHVTAATVAAIEQRVRASTD